jgi:hypothetical protein
MEVSQNDIDQREVLKRVALKVAKCYRGATEKLGIGSAPCMSPSNMYARGSQEL